MALPKINPTQTQAWKKLEQHYQEIRDRDMNQWFKEDPQRADRFKIHWNKFLVDFSKNRLDDKALQLLLELADETGLQSAINAIFSEEEINETEGRKVFHTGLRQKNKTPEVIEAFEKMQSFSEAVIQGEWLGYTDQPITDIVNIGIGGSDLGPKMAVEALGHYRNHLRVHFVSNLDGDYLAEIFEKLNPETTLCIIASKSFTTMETLSNAKAFRKWFLKSAPRKAMTQHFVAVTANAEEANKFGIRKKNIFPMWDWVGGRFSLWSMVGLSLSCAIGFDNFQKLLDGGAAMDQHFKTAEFSQNIPVVLGLLSIWYNNFFKVETEAVIPYSSYLEKFVPYLQQAVMESNGKNVSRNGEPIDYQTGNIIWGSPGTNAQHAFFQLLHQGTKIVPCDFIGFIKPLRKTKTTHHKLMANFFAQTQALLKGKSEKEVREECRHLGTDDRLAIYKKFDGNKPSNTILIQQLTPYNLGSLIAMYEHKIFVQGIIWNIFSYDQWGVELGKKLTSKISECIKAKKLSSDFDSSTASLLKAYMSLED